MKRTRYIKAIATAVCVLAVVMALAGCSTRSASTDTSSSGYWGQKDTSSSSSGTAAQNRQYMAELNQQMSDLQTDMDSFQKAVADKDPVSMNAQLANMQKVIDSAKNTDATERLQTVKDQYVDGLCTTSDAMKAYVNLYTDVSNASVDSATYESRLKEVQTAYDNGVAKLKAADEEVQKIANE